MALKKINKKDYGLWLISLNQHPLVPFEVNCFVFIRNSYEQNVAEAHSHLYFQFLSSPEYLGTLKWSSMTSCFTEG